MNVVYLFYKFLNIFLLTFLIYKNLCNKNDILMKYFRKIYKKIQAIFKKFFFDLSIQIRIGIFFVFSFLFTVIILIEAIFYLYSHFNSFEKVKLILYLISFFIIVITILHLYIFLKIAITRPIKEIIKKIEEVNSGNIKTRIKIFSNDEFGKISLTFNKMLSSLRKKNRELENYSKNLNSMVEAQTKQLREMLSEVHSLKEMQDADYYLTSLLVEQLEKSTIDSTYCDVETFIKQKKEFQFRNKKGEIGGDLCITRKIFLKEEPYIFFLNADAMGKSIQGAVGALITASVMESILERTIKAFIFKNYSPERWLKNSYMELKHIFDVFNTAMVITLIIGLLEEKTGTVYFINSEHPPMILYRNQTAKYIFKDFHFGRLGILHQEEENIYIKVFRLKPNDILIIGSDGKDDIRTNGKIDINQNAILSLIEKTKGNLKDLYEEIKKIGEITDDISLLKIHYKPEGKIQEKENYQIKKQIFAKLKNQYSEQKITIDEIIHFYEENVDFLPAIKLILQYFLKQKDYEKVEFFSRKYFEVDPSNYGILYLIFYSLWKQQKYSVAIEFGEKCYLRNPNNALQLLQLADCYFKTNQFARGEYLVEKAIHIEPENPKIKNYLKKLKF